MRPQRQETWQAWNEEAQLYEDVSAAHKVKAIRKQGRKVKADKK
jgi:hypothetical protein